MKRAGILLCVAALLCAAVSAADWPAWAESAEAWASARGMESEVLETPDKTITRSEAVELFYEAAGSPEASAEPPFSDVSAEDAAAANWAADAGIVTGVDGERFLPDRPVSRQEFAVMLYRQAGRPEDVSGSLDGYVDAAQVDDWAQAGVRWCVESGNLRGRSGGRLVPDGTITAAEAVQMLLRAEMCVETVTVTSLEEIREQLAAAIAEVRQPPVFLVSGELDTATLTMDVQNVYSALLAAQPAYKYAHDLQAELTDSGRLYCTVSYMPYRTGAYPEGFEGVAVGSLEELLTAARNGLTQSSIPIRITEPALQVDDMNRMLQQAGGSYLLCQLNADGTAVQVTPQNGLTHAEALECLQAIDELAKQVLESELQEGMTDREKAEALYTYLTNHVRYDHRYYADRASMPYESMTALGALRDGLAICGGYAQALQTLFEAAGIPCYTVSGQMGSEYHMWNVALLDGAWRYFDATSDRGRADYGFLRFGVTAEELTGYRYVWNTEWIQRLIGEAG